MISKDKWKTYLKKLAEIDAKAAETIRQYIEANGIEDSQGLINYAYGIVTKYGEASAELSCEMYDLMAKTQGAAIPPAEPADTTTIDEVAKGVQWGKYHSPNQIPSIVGRQTRQAGADTMVKNAIRDRAEWAWIPSGDTCAFCITLASRGWQRASKKVLKGNHANHIHANCDCTFGIAFNEKGKREYDSIYDPQKYEDMYYGADGNAPKERINSIRRARYQLNKDYINAQKRDAYQARALEIKDSFHKRSSFLTKADPMADAFGSGMESNYEEIQSYLKECEECGVEVEFSNRERLEYQPATVIGNPGKLVVWDKASYGAWSHEMQHMRDDRDNGWDGARAVWDFDEHYRREERAYNVEIEMAEKAGRIDIADKLRENLSEEKKRIYGES